MPSRQRRNPNSLELVFEDRDLIVIDKPAGLLTIATERERERTAYALLFDHVQSRKSAWRIFIVHRLDREASGLLVFAKNEAVKRHLQDQFHTHMARRTYRAVVEGRMKDDKKTYSSHLADTPAFRSRSVRNPADGKLAVTHVTVLKRSPHRTLIEVELETGRKHQIRVHLSEAGHPIVGDERYRAQTDPIRRLALHATSLRFIHPATGKAMTFDAPMPGSFATLV